MRCADLYLNDYQQRCGGYRQAAAPPGFAPTPAASGSKALVPPMKYLTTKQCHTFRVWCGNCSILARENCKPAVGRQNQKKKAATVAAVYNYHTGAGSTCILNTGVFFSLIMPTFPGPKVCEWWLRGECAFGRKCKWFHPHSEWLVWDEANGWRRGMDWNTNSEKELLKQGFNREFCWWSNWQVFDPFVSMHIQSTVHVFVHSQITMREACWCKFVWFGLLRNVWMDQGQFSGLQQACLAQKFNLCFLCRAKANLDHCLAAPANGGCFGDVGIAAAAHWRRKDVALCMLIFWYQF